MLTPRGTRLAVWGDPIEHSRSPQMHAAAYAVLGLDWHYDRLRVDAAGFADVLSDLDTRWRGLSLTYPLKGSAFAAATTRDDRAEATGAVNTLLLGADGPRGFNTDVGGIAAALREEGVSAVGTARIVGAGATASSAVVALGELGARRIEIVARRPEAAAHLITLGESLGVAVTAASFSSSHRPVDVSIATLPGEAAIADAAADALAAGGGLLLDVVYGHWPTAVAAGWERAGATAVSGLGMLLHQALLQVRVFVTGDVGTALDDEQLVLDAMRRAVVGD